MPLFDARRAVRYVRYNAQQYGIAKDKIAIMGSSSGGHLAALTSTYYEETGYKSIDEIDNEDFVPNAPIISPANYMYFRTKRMEGGLL